MQSPGAPSPEPKSRRGLARRRRPAVWRARWCRSCGIPLRGQAPRAVGSTGCLALCGRRSVRSPPAFRRSVNAPLGRSPGRSLMARTARRACRRSVSGHVSAEHLTVPGARGHCRPCPPRVKSPGALPMSACSHPLVGVRLHRPLAFPLPLWEPCGIRQESFVDGLPGTVARSGRRSGLPFGCGRVMDRPPSATASMRLTTRLV